MKNFDNIISETRTFTDVNVDHINKGKTHQHET